MTTEMSSASKKKLHKLPPNKKIIWLVCGLSLLSLTSAITLGVLAMFSEKKQQLTDLKCETNSTINFDVDNKQLLQGSFRGVNNPCFTFKANAGEVIEVDSPLKVDLSNANQKTISGQGQFKEALPNTGEYVIHVNKNSEVNDFTIKISLLNKSQNARTLPSTNNLTSKTNPKENINPSPTIPILAKSEAWSYNVARLPPFNSDINTQGIVEEILSLAQRKGLPSNRLSISLVNLNASSWGSYGSHADKTPRFPASISKLFWMVAFFGELQAGKKGGDQISEEDLYKMIQNSDNEPASSVLDWLTDTQSVSSLSKDELEIWQKNRSSVNSFFTKAGYQNINITQKNFPIPKLKLLKPEGSDLQMRGSLSNPLRNYLTTYETARLLYEIVTQQSVSREASQKMLTLLRRDYELEKRKEYDSIKGFLGEKFSPSEIDLYSKAGWTSDSRQDAAIFFSRDERTKYILVIFGDDPAFANDWDFFPDASRIVYQNMRR
jgi:hypothetical protein